jgi:hypothetical protein
MAETGNIPFNVTLNDEGYVQLVGVTMLREAVCAECDLPMRWTLLPLAFTTGDHKRPFALAHADCVVALDVLAAHLDMAARMKELEPKAPEVRKSCLQSPDGNCIKYSWCRPGKEQCR